MLCSLRVNANKMQSNNTRAKAGSSITRGKAIRSATLESQDLFQEKPLSQRNSMMYNKYPPS